MRKIMGQLIDKPVRFASPLRYPGGKTRLSNFLSTAIESNYDNSQKITMVEPYAGGAGASLKLLFMGKVNKIIINDLDKSIFSFWKTVIHDTDYLINRVNRINICIDEWRQQKHIYNDPTAGIKELAFATLFLNRTNRSGILTGGAIGGTHQSGIWNVKSRFKKDSIIEKLKKIKEFKNKIMVKNLDGIKLLKKLEKKKDINNLFIFLDPPYYQNGKLLYLNHYNDEEHTELLNFLEQSSLKWLMTYDDVDFIKNLYQNFKKTQFVINHSAYKSKKGKEVAIFSKYISKMAVV